MSGFAPHIEEFQEFFQSRGMSFGSPLDLPSFVDRLGSDTSFRDDMASMVRMVIYRERDGLSRLEFVELVTAAVGGRQAEYAAAPEIREAVRQVMDFVVSVFRTRWNPGAENQSAAGTQETEQVVSGEPHDAGMTSGSVQDVPADSVQQPAVHASTNLFYRAQVVAGVEPAEAIAAERTAMELPANAKAVDAKPVAERNAAAEESAGGSSPAIVRPDSRRRRTQGWMWAGGACALVLAFCAGMFAHQRLIVPLRAANQPYEQAPSYPPTVQPGANMAANAAYARGGGADWRSVRAAPNVRDGRRAVTSRPGGGAGARSHEPVGNSERDVQLLPGYMAPAMIGASPALMRGHLLYAPPPEYPALAKMTHVRGKVLVEAVVGKSGQVIRAEAIDGHHLLRGAAVREVYDRRYRPYTLNGRPTDVATIVTVEFRLPHQDR